MIRRFSSRRERLDRSFLSERLRSARSYDRIAGYFCSSLLEVVGEDLELVQGTVRMVCNSYLSFADVQTARAAQTALRHSWCGSRPEDLLEGPGETQARKRFRQLFDILRNGKLQVRVLPDQAFGLIHGKAGVITLEDGSRTCFMGSANESKSAWQMNYELIWEDSSPEAIHWVQEEFDALWGSPYAMPLADFVVEDTGRLSERVIIRSLDWWKKDLADEAVPDPAPVFIESPVYRKEVGLWEHQKYLVKLVFDAHQGPMGKARYVLADQVGLGKTLQLAMSAQLMALTGDRPILVICPKTLTWQWQRELRDLIEFPPAVWNGKQWVDENGIEYPLLGPEGIRKCPRRVGIVSSGLITRMSEVAQVLLGIQYDCVILDEAHRARRRNLGEGRDAEAPDPNNLLRFMYQIAEKTRSLLLATATPVQLRPIEAWDLLDVLSSRDESVLGNPFSRWHRSGEALSLIMENGKFPSDELEIWEWIRNPLPPKAEHRDFEVLRGRLDISEYQPVVPGDSFERLGLPDRARLLELFPRFVKDHNPFIRRIVRRTREQLEKQFDPETNEPFLKPIRVELLGETERDAILLPPYLRESYELAEEFCRRLGRRLKASGFLKTLLLRRMGSSVYAGLQTAQRMLDSWERIDWDEEDDDGNQAEGQASVPASRTMTGEEYQLLERFVAALQVNQESDPEYEIVRHLLLDRGWLKLGCIIFSQYRDSIQWLARLLTEALPNEPIAVYSGPNSSGIIKAGVWTPKDRDEIKRMVMGGELRLMLGTDAASEGLNLQRLSRLINLDLPPGTPPAWNSVKVESNGSAKSTSWSRFIISAIKIPWRIACTKFFQPACRIFITFSGKSPMCSKMCGWPLPWAKKKRPRKSSMPSPNHTPLRSVMPRSKRLIGKAAPESSNAEKKIEYLNRVGDVRKKPAICA
jgi:hypothetical protein